MRPLLFFMVALLLFSCAPSQRPRRAKLPRGAREPPVVSAPERQPARVASDSLVEEGVTYLEEGHFDRAADTFQSAVNVDPTNGVGFYYLAVVKLRTGEYGAIGDFLDKAEALLGEDPDWQERLEALRQEVHGR